MARKKLCFRKPVKYVYGKNHDHDYFNGTVHSSFTYVLIHVVPNPWDFGSSPEHKWRQKNLVKLEISVPPFKVCSHKTMMLQNFHKEL